MLTAKPHQTTREGRKAELLHEWNRHRNGHVEVLRHYRRTTGSTDVLPAGTSVIEEILDVEYGPAEGRDATDAENAA